MTKPLEQRLYDGNRAKEILDNEVFQQVWTDIEQELTGQWSGSPARDIEGRERIWMMLAMLKKIRACVQTTFETGVFAEKELQYRRSIEEKAKQLFR